MISRTGTKHKDFDARGYEAIVFPYNASPGCLTMPVTAGFLRKECSDTAGVLLLLFSIPQYEAAKGGRKSVGSRLERWVSCVLPPVLYLSDFTCGPEGNVLRQNKI
jgi:hypothetical protein